MEKIMNVFKVSIVIPIYNAEKYLRQCLDSLVSQTLKEIEIICVDDGSTDNSKNIIIDFIKKDGRIKYISMDNNLGSGLARNKGIKSAKGEYLSFVDSDDHVLNENVYEEIYDFACKNNVDMVSTNLKSFNDDGEYFENKLCFEIKEESPILPQDYGIPWYHQKNLYKRSFLSENNIEYPDYRRGQDPVFLTKVLVNIDLVYCLPIDFYAYRTLGVKKIKSEDMELDYIKHFKDVLDILEINDFNESYLNYEKRLYHFFISPHAFSSKSLENNIKKVFGENSRIYTIYKLKTSLLNKEKEIKKLKSGFKYNKSLDINVNLNKKSHVEDSIQLYHELNGQINYFLEEIYEKLFKKNIDRPIRERLISTFPSLCIILKRNDDSLKNAIINVNGYKAIKDNKFFDVGYYLRKYPDVRRSGKDPLLHYIIHGFKEGRTPYFFFDFKNYLSNDEDVKDFNLSPIVHYSLYGQKETLNVGENQEIKVISVIPVKSGTYRKTVVEITFNKPIKLGTKLIELKNNSGKVIPINIKFFKNRIYVIPSESLSKSTKYTVILHSKSITDIFNYPIAHFSAIVSTNI